MMSKQYTAPGRMNRRQATATIAALTFFPGAFGNAVETEVDSTPTEVGTWQELADALARWERSGCEAEHPSDWRRRHYCGTGRWNASTQFVYGFGSVEHADVDIERARGLYRDVLAIGRSDDGRAWAMLVSQGEGK